jgi:hypothetical protein
VATIDNDEPLAVAVVEGSAVAAFPRCSDCWLSTPIWPPAQARLG